MATIRIGCDSSEEKLEDGLEDFTPNFQLKHITRITFPCRRAVAAKCMQYYYQSGGACGASAAAECKGQWVADAGTGW